MQATLKDTEIAEELQVVVSLGQSEGGNAALVPLQDDPLSSNPDDEPDYELGTFTLPEADHNLPRVHRIGLFVCAILALLFCLVYFIEDTNGDAYIVNELVEYIMATTIVSWGTWIVGLGLNAIPNVAESLLLFSLTMLKMKPWYMRRSRHVQVSELEHEHAHEHEHEHEHQQIQAGSGEHARHVSIEVAKDAEFQEEPQSNDDQRLLDPPDHDPALVQHPHHHHEHTTAEMIREVFLMGITPGALGFSASYLVLASTPLWLRIFISVVFGGAVGGAADWIKHSHYNHAAGDVDDQNPLVRTFGTNLWYTDRSLAWKIHETWVKFIIMIHHGGAGLFNWYSVLSVTDLADLMPWWGSFLIASILAAPSFYYEGISETYAYDYAQQQPEFLIHSVSRGGLIAGGIIHSLSFVVLVAKIYQATPEAWGPYYYLTNLGIFSVLSVLLLYPGTLGFYVMQKLPPVDHDGVESVCFDDCVRLLLRAPPRPERRRVNAELRAQVRFWRDPDLSSRVTVLADEEEIGEMEDFIPQSQQRDFD